MIPDYTDGYNWDGWTCETLNTQKRKEKETENQMKHKPTVQGEERERNRTGLASFSTVRNFSFFLSFFLSLYI